MFQETLSSILPKLIQNEDCERIYQCSSYEINITLKATLRQRHQKKRKLWTNIPINMNTLIHHKILLNLIKEDIKGIIYHEHKSFIPGTKIKKNNSI